MFLKFKRNIFVIAMIVMLSSFASFLYAKPFKPELASNKSKTSVAPFWALPKNIKIASTNVQYDVIVIGGGAAGSIAAHRSAVNNDNTLFVIGSNKDRRQSRGMWVPHFSNVPVYKDVKRPVFAMRNDVIREIMDSPFKDKLSILDNGVKSIAKDSNGHFIVEDYDGNSFKGKYVILATGMMDTQPQIQGSIKPILRHANQQEAIYCLLCDGHLAHGKKDVAVIGSSETAAKNAILLHERYKVPNLSILANGDTPAWLPETMLILKKYNITVVTDPIQEIVRDKKNHLQGFMVGKSKIPATLVLINLGSRINNKLAIQLGAALDKEGFVIADEDGLTSVPGLYVAGDLKSGPRKQVYVAWDHAIRASGAINKQLRMQAH